MFENNQTESKRGGARVGAGRKKGSATKKTREIADKAAEDGITPLEYMLQVMRQEPDPDLDARDLLQAITLRFEAAKAAAPYIHPKLSSVEVKGDSDNPIAVTGRIELVPLGNSAGKAPA